MKTSSLLFSAPLLATLLAAQSVPPDGTTLGGTKLSTADIISAEPVGGDGAISKSSRPAAEPTVPGTTVPEATTPAVSAPESSSPPVTTPPVTVNDVLTMMPEVALAPAETRTLRIRGQKRNMDILTDRIHIRPHQGKQFLQYLTGARHLKDTDTAATLYDLRGLDSADLIAYSHDRARTDGSKLLITRRVCVRLAEGVVFSVFAKNSGAVLAERPTFAEEAMILTYVTGLEAMDAVERLGAMPGVLDAYIIVAAKHIPDFLPGNVTYFSGGGPSYTPPPQTDNVDGWACTPFLCGIVPTSAYQWWANNIGIPSATPPPLTPIPTEPTGFLRMGKPTNSVPSRVDLGDFASISYNSAALPKFQGEMADLRLPLAWENKGDFNDPISGNLIKVLIIDDGIQKTHPDLLNSVDANAQRHWNYFTETATPEPLDVANDSHGTSLAGIVGARIKPSGSKIAGVAPKCQFHGVVALEGFVDDFQWADAFAFSAPPASAINGGPPEGNNRGTLKDTDRDGDYLDETRSGFMFNDICLNAVSKAESFDALDLYPEDWLWRRAIRFGATMGRATKGIPYITSAGNGADGHMNANYMEMKNSIYQIPVGGVSDLGRRIAYSVPGAPVVCVAPTWGQELPPYMNWASRPAANIFPANRPVRKNPPIEPDDLVPALRRTSQGVPTIQTNSRYDFNFNGTSASAAQVAGIVALMLEANKNLQARDVKEILLRSCRVCGDVRVDIGASASPADDDIFPTQWRMSPFGRPMHNAFGAGLIDADRAVKIAARWPVLPVNPLRPIQTNVSAAGYGENIGVRNTETGGIYVGLNRRDLIPVNGTAVDIPLPLPPSGLRLEHIEVRVRFYHQRRGDLEIKLIAPGEVGWEKGRTLESDLFVPHRDDYNEDRWNDTEIALRDRMDWTFTTVRHWGTKSDSTGGGTWILRIRDANSQGVNPTPTLEDPVYVPSNKPNPTLQSSQRLDGVGITYHGTFGESKGNDAPQVTTGSLRTTPGTTAVPAQLGVADLGRNPVTGEISFPVTSWDFWSSVLKRKDGALVTTYTPPLPTAAPVDFFEFFPPQRDPVTQGVFLPISSLGLPWPLEPIAPLWVSFLLDAAARPAWWPAPPVSGPQGALTQRPSWLEMTPDELWMIVRNPANNNAATNFIHVRLNRRTGLLEYKPFNQGKYTVNVYAENMLGLSKPKEVTILVTPPGYANWADIYWDPPQLSNPAWQGAVSGWLADPDGDGIMNGLEYVLRLNPTVPDPGPIPAYRIEGNEVVFSYTQDLLATEGALHAQVSEDLTTWADVTPTIVGETNSLRDYEYRLPLAGDTRLFFRLWADYLPNPGNP